MRSPRSEAPSSRGAAWCRRMAGFEWQRKGDGKAPHYLALANGQPLSFAGLWERWTKGDEPIESFTILTTEAAPALAAIHPRQPAIIDPEHFDDWLSPHNPRRRPPRFGRRPRTPGPYAVRPVSDMVKQRPQRQPGRAGVGRDALAPGNGFEPRPNRGRGALAPWNRFEPRPNRGRGALAPGNSFERRLERGRPALELGGGKEEMTSKRTIPLQKAPKRQCPRPQRANLPQALQTSRTAQIHPQCPVVGYHGPHNAPETIQPPANNGKGRAIMEPQQSSQTKATPNADLGERVARIESKMDFVATREDVALVRREIESTHTEIAKTDARIADLRVEVLKEIGGVKTEMADVKTLIANREASMQRWLLGITATAIVGISTALAGVTTASHPGVRIASNRPKLEQGHMQHQMHIAFPSAFIDRNLDGGPSTGEAFPQRGWRRRKAPHPAAGGVPGPQPSHLLFTADQPSGDPAGHRHALRRSSQHGWLGAENCRVRLRRHGDFLRRPGAAARRWPARQQQPDPLHPHADLPGPLGGLPDPC